jgi:transposase
MAKRTKVELFEQIRNAHHRDELSIRGLSRRFGVHRRTVREALTSAIPRPRKLAERPSPAIGPWTSTIDAWLEADKSAPRKQRHTARRVWQRLVDEHRAAVSETSVRRYVAKAKGRRPIPPAEVMVPQTHPLGYEAEVDFGRVSVILAGDQIELWMFVMRLSASGRAFHRVYGNEAQEAFLDGHVRGFAHLGVPVRVRYDNLKPAVVKVMMGRTRAETDRFVALRSHYLFESFYCRPGLEGAHEKGGVEGEVGRFRRRHLVPVPRVDSLAELNEIVASGDRLDDLRHVDGRRLSVAAHYSLERPHLREAPEPFPLGLDLRCRVDPKSRISVRQCLYSVPVRYAGTRVAVVLGAETVEVRDGSHLLARHPRAIGRNVETYELDHYLEVLKVKPGAFAGSSALAQARASGRFSKAHDRFYNLARLRLGERDGTKAMIEVLLAHRVLPYEAVVAGIEAALSLSSVDAEVVLVEARRATEQRGEPVALPAGLARFERPAPSLSRYDELLEAR